MTWRNSIHDYTYDDLEALIVMFAFFVRFGDRRG